MPLYHPDIWGTCEKCKTKIKDFSGFHLPYCECKGKTFEDVSKTFLRQGSMQLKKKNILEKPNALLNLRDED